MPALFTLDIATDLAARRTVLRLQDEDGRHLGVSEVALDKHPPSRWSAMFDTRRHVQHMQRVEPGKDHLAELGRFLGEHVLGPGLFQQLADGVDQRTLLVRLPDPSSDALAAAFARVPWELARAPGDRRSLLARNVVVRAAPAGAESRRATAIEVMPGEAVRVLLVFAEAPASRPLAARLERERLLDLFFQDVLPKWNVEVDVLCHGVTRARLREQVRARGGYHVVHWSGHGHVDALELALDDGEKVPRVSGAELVELFTGAGGFIPPVVFLGACHSGSLMTITDWNSLQASLHEPEAPEEGPGVEAVLAEKVGFTGTALSLVRAGVKQVVAMRYAVGDAYARRLAKRFYRRLLADPAHHPVDAALLLAQKELAEDTARRWEYGAVDHATPLVFGSERVWFGPKAKGSAQMTRRGPQPQPLLQSGSRELDPPHGFVGRGQELTRLGRAWLGREGAPIALIQGLAGLGKTSLAAEAVHLWFGRFDYVLCFQAKGGALSIEELYRRIDQRLTLASAAYRERCQENEMGRVYVDPGPSLRGTEREEALRNNLIDVLGTERILLVLDNFETNLMSSAGVDGYAAVDPAWDRLLAALGDRLRGTGSRVLVTSRHKIAALAKPEYALWVPLGPLPIAEARLFFQGQPSIRELLTGGMEAQQLARRIFDVSRGHPLILARIADLARAHWEKTRGLSATGRKGLADALDRIQGEGFKTLSDIFAEAKTEKDREQERKYLEDVAIGAVDLLIERLSPEARRLAWVVTRAGEPTAEDMIAGVWGDAPSELLSELCGAGVLVREGDVYSFHELIAERSAVWRNQHPNEGGGRTEAEVWKAYGELCGARFKVLRDAGEREQATEVGRRGIRHLARARAFESLMVFTDDVVTGVRDPGLLGQMITDLHSSAAEVPAGKPRWSLRTCLADALREAGKPDQALPLYEKAVEEAQTAEHWWDLGWICQNWANALGDVGQLERAKETYMRSAEAKRLAGRPRVNIMASEFEASRIEVMQGRSESALPSIETRLGELCGWWATQQLGGHVPEAPNAEVLARALASGLDIAYWANVGLKRWQASLNLLDELEQVDRTLGTGEHRLALTRLNRCGPLVALGNLADAKTVTESCIDVFRRTFDLTHEAMALSVLANVWDEFGDPTQATLFERRSLAVCERLSNPGDRAMSHNNLATYLKKIGAIDEAKDHQIAGLVYCLVTSLDLRDSLRILADRVRESANRGETFTLPSLAELLTTPAFAPLCTFLTERNFSVLDLQIKIDDLVEQARMVTPASP